MVGNNKIQTQTVVKKTQYSDLLRARNANAKSKKANKAKSQKVRQKTSAVPIARSTVMVQKSAPMRTIMRTGPRSELLMSLVSNEIGFHVLKRMRINPLSQDTFKWLPSIAQNFESFKFHKLCLRYETRCSTTTAGSVIMSPSYDSADSDAQAATESLLYENKGSKDFAVWKSENLLANVSSMNRLYKHHTCMSDERFKTTSQDPKTIDPGQIFIALDGVIASTFVGKVFLDYDCEFFEPHAPTEPVNRGGHNLQVNDCLINSLTPNYISNSASQLVNQSELASPVLKSAWDMYAQGELLPIVTGEYSAVVGKFLKDYNGICSWRGESQGGNTFLNSLIGFSIGDPTKPYNDPNDVIQTVNYSAIIDPSASVANATFDIVAKAGDYLKFRTPGMNTGTMINKFQLAGSSVLNGIGIL